MKKLLLLALLFVIPAIANIKDIPSGTYKGQGYWKDVNGNKGNYSIEMVIEGTMLIQTLVFETGGVVKDSSLANFNSNGFYELLDLETKAVIGSGYCGSVWCHGTFQSQGLSDAEETMAFVDGNIFRLGSAIGEDGAKFFWEDASKKVD